MDPDVAGLGYFGAAIRELWLRRSLKIHDVSDAVPGIGAGSRFAGTVLGGICQAQSAGADIFAAFANCLAA